MSNDFGMDYSTYRFVKLFFVMLSFSKKSHGLTFEKRLCENSTAELTCPDGNSIEDINIAFHEIENACSLTNDGYTGTEAMNSTFYSSCIGHNSCVLTDKMVNVSHLVADKTWKLNIDYHCIRTDEIFRNSSKPKIVVCPYNMQSVICDRILNKIEIQSVEIMQYLSACKKHNLDQQCTEFIQKNVQKSCSFNNTCQPIIWTTSVNTWDDCIRIPKFVNITFSCKAITTVSYFPNESSSAQGSIAFTTERSLQNESSSVQGIIGVTVGVTVGLITIVGVIVVFIWFVKRKVSDDEQNTTTQRDENKYSIGNETNAIASNSNYEIMTTDQNSRSYDELNQDFRKQSRRDQPDRNNKDIENEYIIPCPVTQKYNSKQTNGDQTFNHVESNIGTRNEEQTMTPLSNSADYLKVL